MSASVCVVIRSAGERTITRCEQIVKNQFENTPLITIREVPFSAAVRKTFEIGIAHNKKWTLALDADILLCDDAIRSLVTVAESLSDNFFMIQGRVLDKLFCIARNGGPHLFRTSLLEKAIDLIPDQHETIRPEAETVNRMVVNGFHRYKGVEVYGIHDFEQYHLDIFCTAFVHAVKFPYLQSYFMKEWLSRELHDQDYYIARIGYSLGFGYTHSTMPSKQAIRELGMKFLNVLNINDKQEMLSCDADGVIQNFIVSKEGRKMEDRDHNRVLRTDKKGKLVSLRWLGNKLEKLGSRLG